MNNFLSVICLVLILMLTAVLQGASAAGNPSWRAASAHAKANSGMLVFVIAREDGKVVRESSYCGSTVIEKDRVLTAWHCVESRARLADTWVVLEDARRFKVKGILRFSPGWDLALLDVPGVQTKDVVEVTEDFATGDEVIGIGSPGGLLFKASWGRVDRIYMGLHEVCDGIVRPHPLGHKEHQIVEVDRVSFFGYSGGGVWNEQGQLIGVHVRGYYWEPFDGYSCSESYKGEYLLFGAAVGGKTVRRFLAGEAP